MQLILSCEDNLESERSGTGDDRCGLGTDGPTVGDRPEDMIVMLSIYRALPFSVILYLVVQDLI